MLKKIHAKLATSFLIILLSMTLIATTVSANMGWYYNCIDANGNLQAGGPYATAGAAADAAAAVCGPNPQP